MTTISVRSINMFSRLNAAPAKPKTENANYTPSKAMNDNCSEVTNNSYMDLLINDSSFRGALEKFSLADKSTDARKLEAVKSFWQVIDNPATPPAIREICTKEIRKDYISLFDRGEKFEKSIEKLCNLWTYFQNKESSSYLFIKKINPNTKNLTQRYVETTKKSPLSMTDTDTTTKKPRETSEKDTLKLKKIIKEKITEEYATKHKEKHTFQEYLNSIKKEISKNEFSSDSLINDLLLTEEGTPHINMAPSTSALVTSPPTDQFNNSTNPKDFLLNWDVNNIKLILEVINDLKQEIKNKSTKDIKDKFKETEIVKVLNKVTSTLKNGDEKSITHFRRLVFINIFLKSLNKFDDTDLNGFLTRELSILFREFDLDPFIYTSTQGYIDRITDKIRLLIEVNLDAIYIKAYNEYKEYHDSQKHDFDRDEQKFIS